MDSLEQIKEGAVGNEMPLDEVLRRCLILASTLRHEPLKEWARSELNGYLSVDNIPSYRSLNVQIYFNAVSFRTIATSQPVPPGTFPPELAAKATTIRLPNPVAEIEGWATDEGAKLSVPRDIYDHLASVMSEREWEITSAWYSATSGAVRGILSTIRTRIVEFALSIEDELPNFDSRTLASDPVLRKAVRRIFDRTILGTGTS